jgi:hypothetical protein
MLELYCGEPHPCDLRSKRFAIVMTGNPYNGDLGGRASRSRGRRQKSGDRGEAVSSVPFPARLRSTKRCPFLPQTGSPHRPGAGGDGKRQRFAGQNSSPFFKTPAQHSGSVRLPCRTKPLSPPWMTPNAERVCTNAERVHTNAGRIHTNAARVHTTARRVLQALPCFCRV